MFNDFYKLYPRKVAKRLAEASWKKMSFTEQTMALEAITNHMMSCRNNHEYPFQGITTHLFIG